MAPYDVHQYLLDRANIHDTILKVPIYYDTLNLSGLATEVYASTIDVDYTSILGGAPSTISRDDWVAQVGGILDAVASSQHVTSGIITDLPQPSPTASRPERVTVYAQVAGNIVGKSQSGDGTSALMQNGGLLEAELQRDDELERQGVNPWRITKYKVTKKWDSGGRTVFDAVKG
ncbi:hypothetical protein VTI74DRAFT_4506 [Chaetomium olivicolor]